jgi:hypothetical protein
MSSSSSSSSASSSVPIGIRIPLYDLAPSLILRAVETAASVVDECSDEAGEFYSMAMAEFCRAVDVPPGAVLVLRLAEPSVDQPTDFSFLAPSPLVFVQVYAKPQTLSTYGSVVGCSDGVTERPLLTGSKVRFPLVEYFVIARQDLLDLIRIANGEDVASTGGSAKRACVRQPEGGGELAGGVGEKAEGSYTLMMTDLVMSPRISNKATACPSNNIGMVGALENLQMVLQVIFSDDFAECSRDFINKLHGVERPMVLVPADLLRYSVEMALRKFFRIVRSVKGSSLPDGLSLRNPTLCVEYLKALFEKLATSLLDFPTMQQHDAYYRFRSAVRSETTALPKSVDKAVKPVTPTVKFEITEKVRSPSVPPPSTKPCAGHLGRLLKAVRRDGTVYKCDFGGKCSYLHISPFGKSDEKLMGYVDSMSPVSRADLGKAINGRELRKT